MHQFLQKIPREHQLALKIAVSIFIFGFLAILLFQLFAGYFFDDAGNSRGHGMGLQGATKYFVIPIISILTYFFSLVVARLTFHPITEHNVRLAEYNRMLAHEMQTPLAVIRGNMELLEGEYDKSLIQSSIEEVDNLREIITGLLFLSQSNSLRSVESCSIREILDGIVQGEFDIQGQDWMLSGNKTLIRQLLQNLIQNAKKYSSDVKGISIELHKNSLSISNPVPSNISIDVEKIFEPLYRGNGISSEQNGYGLGLAIAQKIALIHGIELRAKFELGVFTCTLKN